MLMIREISTERSTPNLQGQKSTCGTRESEGLFYRDRTGNVVTEECILFSRDSRESLLALQGKRHPAVGLTGNDEGRFRGEVV